MTVAHILNDLKVRDELKIKYWNQGDQDSLPDTIEFIAETEAEHRAIQMIIDDDETEIWWDSNQEEFSNAS